MSHPPSTLPRVDEEFFPGSDQTRAEAEAHVQGPGWVALAWFHAVRRDGDWEVAWVLSDPELRLARAQAWLWNNRNVPEIAAEGIERLAEWYAGPDYRDAPYWPQFAEIELGSYLEAWGHWDPDTMGLASRPRLVDIDYEVCLLAKADGKVYDKPTQIVALPFLMHFTDGEWRVANPGGDRRIVPGWPPQL